MTDKSVSCWVKPALDTFGNLDSLGAANSPPHRDTPPFAEIDVLWITAGLGCDVQDWIGPVFSRPSGTQSRL
jgi:hypothetical protein